MSRVFTSGQVESYQRLEKWYLMPPCLTLSIIRYRSRVKWINPGKGVVSTPMPWCSSYRKRSQLYLLSTERMNTKMSVLLNACQFIVVSFLGIFSNFIFSLKYSIFMIVFGALLLNITFVLLQFTFKIILTLLV